MAGALQQRGYLVAPNYEPEQLAKRVFYLTMVGISTQIAIIVLSIH